MKKFLCSMMAFSLLAASPAFAGTAAGDKELSISGSVLYMDPDQGDGSTSIFALGGINWFFTDAFSLGVSLNGNWSIEDEGGDSTSTGLYLEPNYHFLTSGNLVPYVGAHAGVNIYEGNGNSDENFSFGGQAGFKSFLSENVALKVEARYTDYDTAANYGVVFGLSVFF